MNSLDVCHSAWICWTCSVALISGPLPQLNRNFEHLQTPWWSENKQRLIETRQKGRSIRQIKNTDYKATKTSGSNPMTSCFMRYLSTGQKAETPVLIKCVSICKHQQITSCVNSRAQCSVGGGMTSDLWRWTTSVDVRRTRVDTGSTNIPAGSGSAGPTSDWPQRKEASQMGTRLRCGSADRRVHSI